MKDFINGHGAQKENERGESVAHSPHGAALKPQGAEEVREIACEIVT